MRHERMGAAIKLADMFQLKAGSERIRGIQLMPLPLLLRGAIIFLLSDAKHRTVVPIALLADEGICARIYPAKKR